jgi:hypothetical protein
VLRNGPQPAVTNVGVTVTQRDRLAVPSLLGFGAGASSTTFSLAPTNNDLFDGPSTNVVTINAHGFIGDSATVIVLDDEVPRLQLTLSTNTLGEGGTGTLTVTRLPVRNETLVARLSSSDPARVATLSEVTFPSNQAAVTLSVRIPPDTLIRPNASVLISASAPGFADGSATLRVVDDDLPSVTLTVAPETFSEASGANGALGTLTRLPISAQPVTIRLITSLAPEVSVPLTVVIPANQASATFAIGVANDSIVNGTRRGFINAAILDSLLAQPIYLLNPAPIEVTDDDGPTLTLSVAQNLVREGDNPATTGTVSRNTATTNSLLVTLTSADTNVISVPASVRIPFGATSATFPLAAVEDNRPSGTRRTSVTASAGGFNPASAQISVSDIDLPDLVAVRVEGPTNALSGSQVTVSWVVANRGLSDAETGWTDNLYLARSPDGSGAVPLTGRFQADTLGVNASYTNSAVVRLPNETGPYYFFLEVDESRRLNEGNRLNNRVGATRAVTIQPGYRAIASTAFTNGPAGSPVTITGRVFRVADDSPSPFSAVTVRVASRGVRRVLPVTSDANGNFTVLFSPLPNEAGRFALGADHPGVETDPAQDEFVLYGMRLGEADVTARLFPGIPLTNEIDLINLGDVVLRGLRIETEGFPDFLQLAMTPPAELRDFEVAPLRLVLTAGAVPSIAIVNARVRILSAEGAVAVLPLRVTVTPQLPLLTSNPGSIDDGMLRGEQKLIRFTVANGGGAPTGPITVTPTAFPWLSIASPTNLPPLAPGESTLITLLLSPATNLALTRYDGSVAIDGGNGFLNVPFRLRALSDARGDLFVEVSDDLTYYAAGAPLVTNARVTLTDPLTGASIADARTGTNGTVLIPNIAEGTYQFRVSADRHAMYAAPVTVVPGNVSTQRVFIDRQTVSYQWTVVPTQIDDRYEVVLEPVFETEVPLPVVVLERTQFSPLLLDGQTATVTLQLVNHGLVAAERVTLDASNVGDFEVTPLIQYVETLPAKSRLEIPVSVRRRPGTTRGVAAKKAPSDHKKWTESERLTVSQKGFGCSRDIPIVGVRFSWVCGPNRRWSGLQADIEPVEVNCGDEIRNLLQNFAQCMGRSIGSLDFRSAAGDCLPGRCDLAQAIAACSGDACLSGLVNTACGIAGRDFGSLSSGAANLPACSCYLPSLPSAPASSGSADSGSAIGVVLIPGGQGGPGGGTTWTVNWSYSGVDCSPGLRGAGGPPLKSLTDTPAGRKSETTRGGLCARVRLRLQQDVVISRNAFLGTFEIDNDSTDSAVSQLRLAIDIRDEQGRPANDRFGIRGPALTGLENIDGSGIVRTNSRGSAQYTFIPNRDAAPDGPRLYRFGGTLSYRFEGQDVTIPLLPENLTVHPDPSLRLVYFLQRDVVGDDPFTDDVVEPSEPFVLGLRVQNQGRGTADNFRLTTGQPKIVENQRGLLIDFRVIGTRVATNDVTPSLAINLGRIDPGASRVAEFLMTSTLEGKFIEFNASFTHIDGLGDPRLSLIDGVDIKELTRRVMVDQPADDRLADFLVNEVPDPDNLPDTLYLSDGTVAPVNLATGATVDAPARDGRLTVTLNADMPSGWAYLRMPDPGAGFRLVRVVRSDGRVIAAGVNAWTTDRSFPARQAGSRKENLLHLLDANSTGRYTLIYARRDATAPVLLSLGAPVPPNTTTAIDAVEAVFDQAIDGASFTAASFTLRRDGVAVPWPGSARFAETGPNTYRLTGLAGVTGTSGVYELALNPRGLANFAGDSVTNAISRTWVQGRVSPLVLSIAPIAPNTRSNAVDAVDIEFSVPVNPSAPADAIVITRDGATNSIGGPLTVTSLGGNRVRISGLAGATAVEGAYALTVRGSAFRDADGNAGAGSQTATWLTLTTGPRIVSLEAITTNPRNIVLRTLDVTFARPINPATFDWRDVTLTRNGGANLVTSEVMVTNLTTTMYRISNFNWVVGQEGAYTLTVSAAAIADAVGRSGAGSASQSWTMDITKPPMPLTLRLAPDLGLSDNDGLTSTNQVILSGTLATTNVSVRLYDDSTVTDLGAARVVGTTFSLAANLGAAGRHNLRAYAIDAAGNTSEDRRLDVFLDLTPPAASWTEIVSPRTAPLDSVTLTFTKGMVPSGFTSNRFALSRDGSASLLGAGVAYTNVATNVFRITGLTPLTASPGSYQLRVNLDGWTDFAGNTLSGVLTQAWAVVPPSSNLPPTLAALEPLILREGQTLRVTNRATDPNGDALTFSLDPGAPVGAVIHPTTGVLQWRPSATAGGASYAIAVRVTDAGNPPLTATRTQTVGVIDVLPDVVISLGSTNAAAGATANVPINLDTTLGLTNVAFGLRFDDALVGNWALQSPAGEVTAAAVEEIAPGILSVRLELDPALNPGVVRRLGRLRFTVGDITNSTTETVLPEGLIAVRPTGLAVSNRIALAGTLYLVAAQPLLSAARTADDTTLDILVFGRPEIRYAIEGVPNLNPGQPWTAMGEVRVPTGGSTSPVFRMSITNAPSGIFRARELGR